LLHLLLKHIFATTIKLNCAASAVKPNRKLHGDWNDIEGTLRFCWSVHRGWKYMLQDSRGDVRAVKMKMHFTLLLLLLCPQYTFITQISASTECPLLTFN